MAFLQQYRNDRGALANLRGALSESRLPRAWPLLGGFPNAIGDRAYETVAALWAIDPEADTLAAGNLGDTLRHLVKEHNSFELRFKRLLTCDAAEIAERVGPVVRAALAKGQRVNYTRLLSDLLWWKYERVKIEWATAFWGAAEAEASINPELLDTEDAGAPQPTAGEAAP
ncbi:MAG: type I-E CRISPR-associated protein Cse2/CasB [Lentisphaeria bacterium]|jgi:CRISPR type I-E-associated protein CasB/Cse2